MQVASSSIRANSNQSEKFESEPKSVSLEANNFCTTSLLPYAKSSPTSGSRYESQQTYLVVTNLAHQIWLYHELEV